MNREERSWVIHSSHGKRKQGKGEKAEDVLNIDTTRTLTPYLCREQWSSLPMKPFETVYVADVVTSDRIDVVMFLELYKRKIELLSAKSPVEYCTALELMRGEAVLELRYEFDSMLDAHHIKRPREAFNRWLFESRTTYEVEGNKKLFEPLIPCNPSHRSPSMMRELMKACLEKSQGFTAVTAEQVSAEIVSNITTMAAHKVQELHTAITRLPPMPVTVQSEPEVKVSISCGGLTHEILPGHYLKFRRLYHNATGGRQSEDSFHRRLFAFLQRYKNATGVKPSEGNGHHAATPPDVLQCFHELMGATMECFASPINCHFPHFCSAFLDTDVFFGSVGSFFDFHPVEGSFEAGPPYVEELMEAMRVHICQLLRNSTRPLSFCIVIPEWRENPTPVIQNMDLNAEGFVRRMIVVPQAEHVYVDGFQHCLRESYFKPVHNTLVVIMQNDAGAVKWPATDAVEKSILHKWSTVAANVQENPLFPKKREREE